MILTLIEFFQGLEPNAFYAQESVAEPFFDLEERMACIDWQQPPGPGLLRPVQVAWNEANTVATVTGVHDAYHLIVKAKSVIFA